MAQASPILKRCIPPRLRPALRGFADIVRQLPARVPAALTAKAARARTRADSGLVVFVADYPRAREAKLAYGLRAAGCQVVLLHLNAPNFDVSRYFDEVKQYRDAWHALSLASAYSPRVFHVFSLAVDDTAWAFVRHKPGKVVFDTNDVFDRMMTDDWLCARDPGARAKIPRQRYCIEHADGLCCRDLQVRYAMRSGGCQRPRTVVFFPEYCWDAGAPDTGNGDRPSDELHVALCGNFGLERRGETDWGYLDVAERLAAQGIHFHIYPHWFWFSAPPAQFQSAFADYVDLAERTGFVHLHQSLPMDEVVPVLSHYDAGINIIRAHTFGEPLTKYTPTHLRYCGSGRNMDYVDAGLPVIISKSLRLQYSLLARHRVAIEATREMLENARAHLQPARSPEMRRRVAHARSVYSVRRQIGRLIAFYETLSPLE